LLYSQLQLNMKKAIVSVSNDLVSDQRVNKVCTTLQDAGYKVLLVGRKLPDSLPLGRTYRVQRMILLFRRGPLFYAEFNFRLFLFLLVRPSYLLVANDLDTLLPNYLVSKIKGSKLVYDTHEYFTEVPELQDHPFKKKIWKGIERFIFPKLKYVFTVNDSIAVLYEKEYGVKVRVVRNVPRLANLSFQESSKAQLGLPEVKKIIVLQGAGINVHRGAEEAVSAMEWINDAVLLIIGGGDVIEQLKKQALSEKVKGRIIFRDKMVYKDLMNYTRLCDIGLTLDKDTNINYRFSLPNKLFDYMAAGIAVLASPLVEVEKIVRGYDIGKVIERHDPKHIADTVNFMLSDEALLAKWKQNAKNASVELCWEKEELSLMEVYKKL
jgi:glycosyltransferase involved in cell wall biosynthesis